VDHEVEDEEVPGIVVSRLNLSPRFMQELLEAMSDAMSRWQASEGIQSIRDLPEVDDD